MKTHQVDLAIIGDTAAGVVAAVRAARLGLRTLLAGSGSHPGAVFCSLGAVETHYRGNRAPLLQEIVDAIQDHYRTRYGPHSEQYAACATASSMITFEPGVAAAILRRMIQAEPQLLLIEHAYPAACRQRERRIESVDLAFFNGQQICRVEARSFLDATDEGDLAALAGVPYRVGRESRSEFGETHAGRIFTRFKKGQYPRDAVEGRLNLTPKWTTDGILPGSTGEGDSNIQDYSFRLCLSSDPKNRLPPPLPPGYDRSSYLGAVESPAEAARKRYALQHRFLTQTLEEMVANDHIIHGHGLPNRKRSWNATNFTGAGRDYPEADWSERRRISARHLNHALGLLYFLQNDHAVPPSIRRMAGEWGLAKDEFADNGNVPWSMYVREGRRIVGRYVIRESDALPEPGRTRPPLHKDSIAITEFPLDSLPCTTERAGDSLCDGQFFLMDQTRPGHVPYRILLPPEHDNLLVVGAVSATHVAWATMRQVPTLIHIAESAAFASALAHRTGVAPADVPVRCLQRELAASGVMLTFFNDVDMSVREPWVASMQRLGTRGFFPAYDARPQDLLTPAEADEWIRLARDLGAPETGIAAGMPRQDASLLMDRALP